MSEYTKNDFEVAIGNIVQAGNLIRPKISFKLLPSEVYQPIFSLQTTEVDYTKSILIKEAEYEIQFVDVLNPDYVYRRPAASDYYNDSEPNGPKYSQERQEVEISPAEYRHSSHKIKHHIWTLSYPALMPIDDLIGYLLSDESAPEFFKSNFAYALKKSKYVRGVAKSEKSELWADTVKELGRIFLKLISFLVFVSGLIFAMLIQTPEYLWILNGMSTEALGIGIIVWAIISSVGLLVMDW